MPFLFLTMGDTCLTYNSMQRMCPSSSSPSTVHERISTRTLKELLILRYGQVKLDYALLGFFLVVFFLFLTAKLWLVLNTVSIFSLHILHRISLKGFLVDEKELFDMLYISKISKIYFASSFTVFTVFLYCIAIL